ncbi:MAG TPA: MarR family winged helix-turn-helix transcriptional regulator [Burkholderiales bacterium]|jgi:DNA-binding MarR family transcriptional regulator|nr:MarR family winged helix-turn-helix transcriptional regulator [Burkholderiales bacterium]
MDYLLQDAFGYQIRITGIVLRRHFLQTYAAADIEITPEQLTLLALLARRDDWTLSELARANNQDKGAVTRMTQGMQASRWIRVSPDPASGRNKTIRLTAKGRTLLERSEEISRRRQKFLEQALSMEERRQLIDMLERIREHALG